VPLIQRTAVLKTDAGMHLIWDRAHFNGVDGYETWSAELEGDADILRHVVAAHVVPINIHSDGAYAFTLRADVATMPRLSEDEERRVVVRSERFRFDCRGTLDVSGIEHVERDPSSNIASMKLPVQTYDVVVHLMNYDDIPERTDQHPDFIVTVGPAEASAPRQSIETFERPQIV